MRMNKGTEKSAEKGPAPTFSPPSAAEDDLGLTDFPLCREPWESTYILRRGILPCPYGNPIASMSEWASAWNSPQLQEIRLAISRGKLSPYCLDNRGCPIVLKYLRERSGSSSVDDPFSAWPRFLGTINRLLFRIPGRLRRRFARQKQGPRPFTT
jgi:hypothetical protein